MTKSNCYKCGEYELINTKRGEKHLCHQKGLLFKIDNIIDCIQFYDKAEELEFQKIPENVYFCDCCKKNYSEKKVDWVINYWNCPEIIYWICPECDADKDLKEKIKKIIKEKKFKRTRRR